MVGLPCFYLLFKAWFQTDHARLLFDKDDKVWSDEDTEK